MCYRKMLGVGAVSLRGSLSQGFWGLGGTGVETGRMKCLLPRLLMFHITPPLPDLSVIPIKAESGP